MVRKHLHHFRKKANKVKFSECQLDMYMYIYACISRSGHTYVHEYIFMWISVTPHKSYIMYTD